MKRSDSAAPPGGSGGEGFNTENIGSGEHDLKSLTRLPVAELLRRVVTRELTWRTGHCAGCNHEYREDERNVASGLWTWHNVDVAMYTLCWRCAPRVRNRKFRARIRYEAYRSLFMAGPDDIGGTA